MAGLSLDFQPLAVNFSHFSDKMAKMVDCSLLRTGVRLLRMTSKQENKLSMYLAVMAVCIRNSSTWQTLQAFVDAYADFGARVTHIQNLAQSQAVNSTGLSADKEALRKTMAVATVEVALATNAYAKKVKNNDLAAKTSVSISTYMEGRDTIAATNALNIHAAATANLVNLAAYGVTAAKLTALKAKIDAYAASLSKPRDAVGSGSTATKQMGDEFDAADAALNDQMDALVPQFAAANATFVTDYTNARIIVDSSGGKAKAKTPAPHPGPA